MVMNTNQTHIENKEITLKKKLEVMEVLFHGDFIGLQLADGCLQTIKIIQKI